MLIEATRRRTTMAYETFTSQMLDLSTSLYSKIEITAAKTEYVMSMTDLYSWMVLKKDILTKHIRRELTYRSPMYFSLTVQAIVKTPQLKTKDFYYSNDILIYAANDETEIETFLTAMFKYVCHNGKTYLQEKNGRIQRISKMILECRSRDDLD